MGRVGFWSIFSRKVAKGQRRKKSKCMYTRKRTITNYCKHLFQDTFHVWPGLFESVYEEVFCYEFAKTDIPFTGQQTIPLIHETIKIDIGFRTDVIADQKVIVELKSIEA